MPQTNVDDFIDELNAGIFKEKLATVDMEKMIIFYCAWPSEATSARVADRYAAKGYSNVWALRGGVNSWKTAGFPDLVGLDGA